MSPRLLLISSSRIHGQAYMAYCKHEVQDFWGSTRKLLFIPYASVDHASYTDKVRTFLEPFGFEIQGLNEVSDPHQALLAAEGVFTGGGNTFLLVHSLQTRELMAPLREKVLAGMPYMGSSAGSNIACPTLKTTNDMPIIQPPSFETLNLLPLQINPHYLDPQPDSTHMGESREDRIREFHQLNTSPVLGLREGALLRREGTQLSLLGVAGARLFQAGQASQEFSPGADLSFLLA
ncbi:dipeptidase PepE [bacterium (Candidatus Blackallbacteria) CG17_big_fil_post_rev_8_21_14_2_50_48_46]|uniref:dipeptidase E n=1 Tax=bacterium (Candidatus Blackallbacteria) CG17_big_fil_post_rev_8_21_14_2_50_48_46 TaxID=2014261 RepID=A0A2M7G0B8_9BACT|nr:MAG: dipeptidase PepE [bacterium (Candidatus Blackallbacteria) CG18_big_fil_WC_8_21_14_2_50_49_26]PIW15174.1 MAG: dipeptidase PepE [bacterium (Candidatus Blackallbacteria) CG17_big_fil_post_rev_8_21_14_2_50_48_46]PIW50149.1 MAG: dipeptidase PepE [bacterium (Candidatus Blackallbacteria) CG13_big_fil_rev_8_21_14_2_50_49_14]